MKKGEACSFEYAITGMKKFRFSTTISVAAAYCAYFIGSGFASGQEALQYFAAYGGIWTMVAPLILFACMWFFWSKIGYNSWDVPEIVNPADAFDCWCGFSGAARIADWLTVAITGLFSLSMFAGCGATLEQYLGIPQWVGAIALGIIAYIVIWFGLESVTNVLSCAGIIIIGFVVLIGVYCLVSQGPAEMAEGADKIGGYVDSGDVLIANVFGIKNPILSGAWYFGTFMVTGYAFIVAQGKRLQSYKESNTAALLTGFLFTLGMVMVVCAILANIDYIVEVEAQVPLLAVVANALPVLQPVFAIVVVLGIFTTITGYSWTIGRRFAHDRTAKQRIIVGVLMLIGILGGAFVPFGTLVNWISPASGLLGLIITVYMGIYAILKARKKKSLDKESQNQTSTKQIRDI